MSQDGPASRQLLPAAEDLLDDLAGSLLDGHAIDWAEAESSAGAAAPVVRQLRLVASVAQLHRDALPLATATSAEPIQTWGHLRVLERVGRGAYGEVFRAWDTRLDREVALKLIDAGPRSSGSDSIIQEGRLLARVRHPNVVTIHGAERIGNRIGLWMEFVRGLTLEQLLRQGTVFSNQEVVQIGVDLSRAVAAVHAADLLHRDIKAQNVIRAEDGRTVLMDFGTGKELNDSSSDLTGTPLYLAPEVMAGQPATVQSDIYSLGVLLYHLLTGVYPVQGRTIRDIRRAHEHHDRVALRASRPDVRPALARVIERAIEPDPAGRYASVDALARDLASLHRRPTAVRFAYRIAAVAAIGLLAAAMFGFHARLTGDRRSLATRLSSAVGFAPSYLDNPRIVVLPFKHYTTDAGDNLLVESVTAGLIHQLAIIKGLEVRSETSSFMLKDKPHDLAEIGQRLNVNLAIEGDAQLSGKKLLINAALVSIDDDRRVWSRKVDRELISEGDVVGVVEDLTREIVNELRLKLGRTQRRYDNIDIKTQQTYLEARALRERRLGVTRQAISLLQDVIRKDEKYAPALAALALTYGSMTTSYPDARGVSMSPTEALALMEPLTQRAWEIDPMLAEVHAAFGTIHSLSGRWAEAEKSFRRAIDLDPSVTAVYGDFVLHTLLPWGRSDEAVSVMLKAVEVDPLSLDARRVLARAQAFAGMYDAALDNCTQVLNQDPTYAFAEEICGIAHMFKGDMTQALAMFTANGHADLNEQWIGYIYAKTGRRAEAEAIAERNRHLPHRPAMIYAALGDKDRAFEALERLAALNRPRAALYLSSQELASLHDDPRAAILRQKLGFPR